MVPRPNKCIQRTLLFLCVFCYCSHFCILFFETWHQQTAGKVWSASVVSAGQTTHIASQIKTLEPGQTLTLGATLAASRLANSSITFGTSQSKINEIERHRLKTSAKSSEKERKHTHTHTHKRQRPCQLGDGSSSSAKLESSVQS